MPSVLDPLYRWADRTPDKLLYAWLDVNGNVTQRYTYATFLARTADIARHLHRQQPLAPGSRVLLAYPPGLEVICAFFACVRLGLVPVPVYPPTRSGFAAALTKMNFIAQDCGASVVLTDRAYYWSMKVNRARHRIQRLSWTRDTVTKLPWVVSSDAPRSTEHSLPDRHTELLFLQYTSGSTADPKGVMVSHSALLTNGDAVVDHLPVGVSWLPQYHDMGLIGYYLFFAMKGGTTYGFSPMDFIRRPALWLETISRYRGTASSAPNFAYEYCLRPGKLPPETFDGLDLTSLRFLMTAAEPVRPHTYRAFLRAFAPYGLDPKSFFSAYGLAEYTLAVSNYGRTIRRLDRAALQQRRVEPAPRSAPEEAAVELVSCGRPVAGTELAIVDDTARPPRAVAPGGVGEVWVRGPSRCSGYWGRPEHSAATFRAPLGDNGTWLRTGDLGFVADGELYLCGRSKDLIIVRGQNHYPQDIERIVEQDPTVRRGCVSAFGHDVDGEEKVIVVAELRRPTQRPDAAALQAQIQQLLGVSIEAFVYIKAKTLPKTSSGKRVRHLARTSHLDGTLDTIAVVHPLPSPAPRSREATDATDVTASASAVFAQFGLTGDETWTLPEAGLDSIQLVDFAHALRAQLEASGDGALAAAVDLQVLQTIALCELSELLTQLEQAAPHARLRFRRVLGTLGQEHRQREHEMMRRDARLRFDPAHLPQVADLPDTSTVLLTGATGFFGPFLLASLLRQTPHTVVALARAEDDRAAKARVLAGLRELHPEGLPPGWAERIEGVCGDLAQVNLGLSTTRWEALAEQIDAIYHNGAWVNYLFDYARMRDPNVGGTSEIVRLAMSHRPKVLNHISTTFVFGWSVKETLREDDTNQDMDLLDFGYSQSKWVSEQIVFDAMRQGLQARIFRPALITPSVDGAGSHFDISVRLLAFMLSHSIGTTAANQVSFSPADVTADNIIAIAQLPRSVGATVHVTRDVYASMQDITTILGRLTDTAFTQLSLDAFVPAVIERCEPGDILFPLLDFFVRSTDNITAMEFKRYDNSRYRQLRDASPGGRADPPLEDVVGGLLRFMRRKGLVEAGAPTRSGL